MEKNLKAIWAYLDNEMTVDERQSFESRLNADEELQSLFKQHQKIQMGLKDIPLMKAPESVASNVLAAIEAKPSYLVRYDSFMGLNFIVGSLLSLIALIILVFMFTSPAVALENNARVCVSFV